MAVRWRRRRGRAVSCTRSRQRFSPTLYQRKRYIFHILPRIFLNYASFSLSANQCCGSKYIEFGSGSRSLAQFGSGSRSGPGSRVRRSILKEKIKNNFREKLFSWKSVPGIFLKTTRTKCHLNKFLLSWVSDLWIYILNLTSFVYILSYIYSTCADPYSEYGSGSRRVLNSDPMRIWIHKNAANTIIAGQHKSQVEVPSRKCYSERGVPLPC